MAEQNVTIIGAGLAGSLLSIYLARRGFEVTVFEARGDMRKEEVAAGRSINLALSDRGIAALREVGMDEYMLAEAVPMTGRLVAALTAMGYIRPTGCRAIRTIPTSCARLHPCRCRMRRRRPAAYGARCSPAAVAGG